MAAASTATAHRGILLPGNPARSIAPETQRAGSGGGAEQVAERNRAGGARAGRDPAVKSVPRHLPGGGRTAYASANWAGGWVNPLGADYAWMYDDGPGGNNLDCKTGSSRGAGGIGTTS